MNDTILAFLKTQKHAVISTCGRSGHPEAALIGFGETSELELIFGTYRTSRKYKNIQENSRVAMVVGFGQELTTVQYEGEAIEIFGDELEAAVALYHAKVPSAAVFKSHSDQSYFKVKPVWTRYTKLGSESETFEVTFP